MEKIRVLKNLGIEIDALTVGTMANLFSDEELKIAEQKMRSRSKWDPDGATKYFPTSEAGREFQGRREGLLGPWTLRKLRRVESSSKTD